MLRSMFAGVSGLRAHQTMMDVVGNNISNVNTHGYKSTRATFQDALYQTVRGAAEGADGQGGVNPMQIGLGSRVSGVDQNFTQGGIQTTNRATDVSIQGEGFFIVGSEEGDLYTRSGAFNWDSEGNLVSATGGIVQGAGGPVQVAPDVLAEMRDISIGADGSITGRGEDGEPQELAQLAIATFANPNGLDQLGGNMFAQSGASGGPAVGVPGAEGRGTLEGGTLEMSNVDLAEEFTNLIMAQRGFQASSRTITTSDEMLQELVNLKR